MGDVSKEKTAFSTGSGLWQFHINASWILQCSLTFKRNMEQVLAVLSFSVCLIYLDDIFEEEMHNL